MRVCLLNSIIIFCLFCPGLATAQWQSALSGTTSSPVSILAAGNRIWVNQEQGPGNVIRNVAFSDDDGQRFSYIGRFPNTYTFDGPARTMTQVGNRLFASGSPGLFSSDDGGQSWTAVQTTSRFRSLGQLFHVGNRLVAAQPNFDGAVLVSTDEGRTWQTNPVPNLKAITVHNDSLFVCTPSTVLASADYALTWTTLFKQDVDFEQIAVAPSGIILVSSRNGQLYQSNRTRTSWQAAVLTTRTGQTDPSGTQQLAVNERVWLVSTQQTRNVYASINQGSSWFEVSVGLPANRRYSPVGSNLGQMALSAQSVYLLYGATVWRRSVAELRPDYIAFPDSLLVNVSPRDQTLLTWRDNNLAETGYRVERAVGATGNYVEVATLPANTTSYRDEDVTNGQTYQYRVRTVTTAGFSAYSPVLTAVRPARSCQAIARRLGDGFTDVQMVTPERGYLIEEASDNYDQIRQLLETTDGGKSWHLIMPRLGTTYFNSVTFNGPDRGFVVSGYGNLLQTRDGGKSWRSVVDAQSYLLAPHFVSATVGFLVGTNGKLYTTRDAGDSWQSLPGISGEINSLWFVSERVGYVAAGGSVLKTTDAGQTWVTMLTDQTPYARINKVYFQTDLIGFALGTSGLFQTVNAGATWTRLPLSARAVTLTDITQNSQQHLFINGQYPSSNQYTGSGSVLFRSQDQGVSWDTVAVPKRGVFTHVSFSGNTGCLAGPNRSIATSYNGGVSWQLQSYNPQQVETVSRIGRSMVAASRSDTEASATVYWSRDAGESWQNYVINQPQLLNDKVFVRLLAPRRVMLVTPYQISQTTDDGQTWQSQPITPPTRNLYRLTILNENVMYGIGPITLGENFRLIKTTDGGVTWQVLPTDFLVSNTLFFLDERTGFVGGNRVGELYKTSDGGQSWQRLSLAANGNAFFANSIQFVTPSVGFVWDSGQLHKTTNGGQSWQLLDLTDTRLPGSDSQFINSCHFVTADLGYVQRAARLSKTTDGGSTWQLVAPIAGYGGYGQITADDEFVFLAGSYYGSLAKALLREPPALPHEPAGRQVACLGTVQTYSITNQDTYSFDWKLTGGGQLSVNRNQAHVAVTTPGTYTLTVRSVDECGSSDLKTIVLPVYLRPALPQWVGQDLTPCPDQPARYRLQAVAGLRYNWQADGRVLASNHADSLTVNWAGPGGRRYVLRVEATDGFCESDSIGSTIILRRLPDVPTITQLSAGELQSSSPLANQWLFQGQPVAGATSQNFIVSSGTGNYAVAVDNDCGQAVSVPFFIVITSIDPALSVKFALYPNPASGLVLLDAKSSLTGPAQIEARSVAGQLLFTKLWLTQSGALQTQIDVSQWPAGIYTIVLTIGTQRSTARLLKQ